MNSHLSRLHAVSALSLLLLCSHAGIARAETRDLIVVAGQSNAVGFDAYAEDLPPDATDSKTLFWWRVGDPPPDEFDGTSARQWTQLQFQPRTEAMSGDAAKKTGRQYGNFNRKSKGGFGPEIGLARTLASREAKPLAILKTAFSGTSVAGDWNIERTGETQNCYRAMLEESRLAIEAAKKTGLELRVRALVWVQGESDANAKDAPLYGANLTRMLEKLRADLAAPEMILLLGVNTRFGNGNNQFMPGVIESQKSVAAKLSRTRYVDTDGAETLPPSHTHFTAQGTLEIGRRYAEALLEVEGTQYKAK
jgi:lysophospholipase L1-like esterase